MWALAVLALFAGAAVAGEYAPTDPGWYGAGQTPPPRLEQPWQMPARDTPLWSDHGPPARWQPRPDVDPRPVLMEPRPELFWPPAEAELRGYRFREDRRLEPSEPPSPARDYRFRPLTPAERRRQTVAAEPGWRPLHEPRPRPPEENWLPPPWLPLPGYEGAGYPPPF